LISISDHSEFELEHWLFVNLILGTDNSKIFIQQI
jgi:hypothetical protein